MYVAAGSPAVDTDGDDDEDMKGAEEKTAEEPRLAMVLAAAETFGVVPELNAESAAALAPSGNTYFRGLHPAFYLLRPQFAACIPTILLTCRCNVRMRMRQSTTHTRVPSRVNRHSAIVHISQSEQWSEPALTTVLSAVKQAHVLTRDEWLFVYKVLISATKWRVARLVAGWVGPKYEQDLRDVVEQCCRGTVLKQIRKSFRAFYSSVEFQGT